MSKRGIVYQLYRSKIPTKSSILFLTPQPDGFQCRALVLHSFEDVSQTLRDDPLGQGLQDPLRQLLDGSEETKVLFWLSLEKKIDQFVQ